jgi:hypothetical protein
MAHARGVYRNGKVEPEGRLPIPENTPVGIEYPVPNGNYQEAMARQLDLMKRGFELGPRSYRRREDLYGR